MKDITEDLKKNEGAVAVLGQSTHARWLRMNLLYEDGTQRETDFYQDTCGMMPMQDLFNKVRAVLKSFVDGEYGIKLGELFRGELEMPDFNGMTEEEVDKTIDDNKGMVLALLKIVEIVPELQLDIFALTLGVQRKRIDWFKEAISEPPHRGGLTVHEGFDILRLFIRQNAQEIRDFFTEEAKSLASEFRLAMDQGSGTESSTGGTPSSTSAPAIPASA